MNTQRTFIRLARFVVVLSILGLSLAFFSGANYPNTARAEALTFSAPGVTPARNPLAPAYTGCGEVASPPRTNTAYEQAVFDLTNEQRAANGKPPLKRWDGLDQSAQYHAIDMAVDNYFDHSTYDRVGGALQLICAFSARVRPFYFSAQSMVGENIVGGWSTPAEAIAAWMVSPGHRANILSDNFRKMGVGYHYESASDFDHYWVQNFGQPYDQNNQPIFPLIINQDEVSTTSTNVTIYIYGYGDPASEWEQMRLRNDGGAWGSWKPFQNSFSWTRNNTSGIRTVDAELKWNTDTFIASDSINYTGASTRQIYLPLVVR